VVKNNRLPEKSVDMLVSWANEGNAVSRIVQIGISHARHMLVFDIIALEGLL